MKQVGCTDPQVADGQGTKWYRHFRKGIFGEKDDEFYFEHIEWEIFLYKFGVDLAR